MYRILIDMAKDVTAPQLEHALVELQEHLPAHLVAEHRTQGRHELLRVWHVKCVAEHIRSSAGFSHREVEELIRRFGALHPSGRTMCRKEFAKTVTERWDLRMPPEAAEQLFDAQDTSGSGEVDFRALACCLAVLSKGTFYERVGLCFTAYDTEREGHLEFDLCQQLVLALCKVSCEAKGGRALRPSEAVTTHETLTAALRMSSQAPYSGTVAFSDFYDVVQVHPELLRCFGINTTMIEKEPATLKAAESPGGGLPKPGGRNGRTKSRTKSKSDASCEVCK